MRILVLGSGGQLGRDLTRTLRQIGHQVTSLDRTALDITDAGAVRAAVDADYQRVVNCAAYTQVDRAETEADLAFAVNRDGARNVAQACSARDVPLCHLSTDFVFTQDPPQPPRPWLESDLPSPRGVYAESKRAGELECLAVGGRLYLVRTSWLYGGDGPNFPLTICRVAARDGALRVVADQHGSPTWTGHLASALAALLEGEDFGLYHLSGTGATTWFHFAGAVLEAVGLKAELEPTTTAAWAAPAPRPRYSVLDNSRWRQLGRPPLPPWEEGLRAYLTSEAKGAMAQFADQLRS